MSGSIETITLGGGCFWCLEAVYERVDGVVAVESGYCNGHVLNPSYEQVCSGRTGHVEVVRVSFDADRIGLRDVLEIFLVIHDPTTLNRQGNDVGSQYRSGVYWDTEAQRQVADAVLTEWAERTGRRPVTEVLALRNYSRAEAYHQHYFANHPEQGYCAMVVAPKVQKFMQNFRQRVRQAA